MSSELPLAALRKDQIVYRATHKCQHRHTYLQHPKCYVEEKDVRVGFLDIEASHLTADIGIILSWNILRDRDDKLLGDCITKADIEEAGLTGKEDRRVTQTLLEAMTQFDRLVGYYSTGFDIPFIRTRAVINGLEFPEYGSVYHNDAYYTVKHKFKLLSNRQENAARALLGETQKTKIEWPIWRAAARGNPKALQYVVEHNVADVRDLKRVYYVGLPFKKQQNTSV